MAEEQKQEKTPAQLKEEKIKKFNENPDGFVDLDEVIVMALRSEKGPSFYMGGFKRHEIMLIYAEINFRIIMALMEVEVKRNKEQASAIVPARGPVPKPRGMFGRPN
jgi:Ca2+-binding EF-hand superfamily protein